MGISTINMIALMYSPIPENTSQKRYITEKTISAIMGATESMRIAFAKLLLKRRSRLLEFNFDAIGFSDKSFDIALLIRLHIPYYKRQALSPYLSRRKLYEGF